MTHHVTRRDFLRGTVAGATGIALRGPEALAQAADASGKKSVVCVARAADALTTDLKVNAKPASLILNQAVAKAAGEASAAGAWKKLFRPDDIVGIVTTTHMNPTHPELADEAKRQLVAVGVSEENVRITHRDTDAVKECTALIAMPALKAHWLTGLGTVLKLYILYSGKPSSYHNENSAKLGEIWNLRFLKGKTRLVLVDALRPLCDKGPQPDPRYLWSYGGVIASTDPVAAEAVGLKIIQAKRDHIKGEPWPLSPPPLCLAAADKEYGLGTSDLGRIDIKAIGWKEEALL